MENSIIRITPEEISHINEMDDNTLTKYAHAKSSQILELVGVLSQKIRDAKELADYAKKIKTGFCHPFGTRKKATITADALTMTNEAVESLSVIQQETIMFTCVSARFARAMHETMSALMASGFRDTNGNLHELDKNTQEFAQHILDAADDFARKQAALDAVQNKLEEQINAVSGVAENNRVRLDENMVANLKRDRRIYDLEQKIARLDKTRRSAFIVYVLVSILSIALSCFAVFIAIIVFVLYLASGK